MAIVRLEGLTQLKNSMSSSGIKSATFRGCCLVPEPTTLPRTVSFSKRTVLLGVSYLTIFLEGLKKSMIRLIRSPVRISTASLAYQSVYCNVLLVDCVTDRSETTLTRYCLFEFELLQMAAHGGIL
jgi:hypothetical protein